MAFGYWVMTDVVVEDRLTDLPLTGWAPTDPPRRVGEAARWVHACAGCGGELSRSRNRSGGTHCFKADLEVIGRPRALALSSITSLSVLDVLIALCENFVIYFFSCCAITDVFITVITEDQVFAQGAITKGSRGALAGVGEDKARLAHVYDTEQEVMDGWVALGGEPEGVVLPRRKKPKPSDPQDEDEDGGLQGRGLATGGARDSATCAGVQRSPRGR